MKNHSLLVITLMAMPSLLQAQNTFPANGYVGIGTASPNQKLQVVTGNIRVSDPGSYPYGINIDMHAPGGLGQGIQHHLQRDRENDGHGGVGQR